MNKQIIKLLDIIDEELSSLYHDYEELQEQTILVHACINEIKRIRENKEER